jgi:hypothetical protein
MFEHIDEKLFNFESPISEEQGQGLHCENSRKPQKRQRVEKTTNPGGRI